AVVGLETLPLTPSGKVDRRALPAPEAAASPGEPEEGPRTSTEELLAGIWREVLGTGPGVHDDFFEMGGHSLLATQVVARVRAAFRVDLPVRAIFEASTVAALAAVVDAARREDEAPLVPVDRAGPLPLSFAQERLWFLSQMGTGGAGYTVPGAIRLTGVLDVPALERALAALVRRHETLRTVFAFADGRPVQVVRPEARTGLPLDDLTDFPAGGREAEAMRRAGEEVRRPFDLAEGPLLRVRLLRLGAEEHVLVIAMHHIVSDGWSMAVLLRELGTAYAAEVSDGAPELPPLPVQYGDYAVWQRARFSGDALDRQLAWWKDRLAGAPPLLEIPTDRPRPPVQRYRGAQVSRVLPPALADSLRELGGREGATLFMVLLGTLQSLLSRYSGQDEVVVGTPIAGRTRPELEGIVGPFINTLALRTDLGGDPSFRALLARVRETTLGAYAHQDVPFDRVVDALQPERMLSNTPLFQVELALQNIPGIGMRMPKLEVDSVDVDAGSNKFDLSLFAQETPEGVHCFLAYDTDLFDAGTVERLLARLERFLGAVAAEPDRPVSAHPLLDEAERERVLVEWNRSGAEYPRHLCLHQLFEAQAARTPDAEAVRFLGCSLTYAELDRRANRLAHHLRGRGVGPEVQVGICMERGFEMFVAVLGILKAGGAYVPVDPLFPRERLAFTLEGVALVLAQAAVRDAVPEGREVLCLDTEWDAVAGEPAAAPESGVTPENLAYVLYTSGSTGRPKGVLVGHRGMTNLCVFQMRTLGCGPGERVLHFAPLHFDASAAEIFMALGSGATVVTAPRETVLPGPDLVRLLREERVSNVKFTPSALAALPMADLPDLRTLLAGGEASTAELVRRWGPGRRFVNVYGPTENSVRISFGEAVVGDDRPPPIGRPLANVQAYVLDRHLEPVPPGVPGELYSAGEGVTRGYAGRPDLTAAAFLPDPFGPPGTRLYRTGDRARWREDGELEFLGRVDFQVKIRGFRIEPGEIEAVLSRHPELYECAVLPRDDGAGLRLVAYLVPREGARPAVAGVRAYLRDHLPDYMVPSAWVFLDALPLGPSGKLDRRALPAPGREADEGFVAPRAGLQETIAGVWREVLGLERVGAGDNFFEVGGHSLLLVRLHARLREETGREVTVVDLFRFPTVASLAAHLEPEDPDGGGEAGPRTRDRAALRKSMSRRRG
ncbi:MAG TPA: amino acid adenylation domain-containing protein, partial [Longimicrobiaceae bacterium]